MKVYTIGFTKKSARQFFELLAANGVQRIIDIRLRPGGQLAGFAKKDDLAYFLEKLVQCDYMHLPQLAPTPDILDAYRKNRDWSQYVAAFERLMEERDIPGSLDRSLFEEKSSCLLCSEATPEKCHRRLVAERLSGTWNGVEVIHL